MSASKWASRSVNGPPKKQELPAFLKDFEKLQKDEQFRVQVDGGQAGQRTQTPSPSRYTSILVSSRTSSVTSQLSLLIDRLLWKSQALLLAHQEAMSGKRYVVIRGVRFDLNSNFIDAPGAVLMFKKDFFEFYALLEKTLVVLLGLFDITVDVGHANHEVPNFEHDSEQPKDTILGDSKAYRYYHRYHSNVLRALSEPSCPLHQVLGQGQVLDYITIAKTFRNKWKEAEQGAIESQDVYVGVYSKHINLVENLDLEVMLATILGGLKQAEAVARNHVEEKRSSSSQIHTGTQEAFLEKVVVDEAMDLD